MAWAEMRSYVNTAAAGTSADDFKIIHCHDLYSIIQLKHLHYVMSTLSQRVCFDSAPPALGWAPIRDDR